MYTVCSQAQVLFCSRRGYREGRFLSTRLTMSPPKQFSIQWPVQMLPEKGSVSAFNLN
jgi:hypothetical protein